MKNYETKNCIICRKPSRGKIACGHVKRGTINIVTTFCSEKCYRMSSRLSPVVKGSYGPWRKWMGMLPSMPNEKTERLTEDRKFRACLAEIKELERLRKADQYDNHMRALEAENAKAEAHKTWIAHYRTLKAEKDAEIERLKEENTKLKVRQVNVALEAVNEIVEKALAEQREKVERLEAILQDVLRSVCSAPMGSLARRARTGT